MAPLKVLMDNQLKASVIIPTYNGGRKIHRLLDSLANQTLLDFEVVVVIDGSSDDTAKVIEKYRERFRQFDFISQQNGGRAAARNSGARIARADLLIFYDDDMEPYRDSVERHITFHQRNFGMMCGHTIEIDDRYQSDIQNYKAWLTRKWTGRYAEGVTVMNADNLFFSASNSSVQKATFWRLNGFNRELTDAEDYELAYRAIYLGIPVYYDKDNKAVHLDLIDCRGYIRRLREYGAAHKKLTHLIERPINKGPLSAVKKFFYGGFAFAFWVRLIDAGVFRFLPKIARYRLYSVIIHTLANERATVVL
jgi:glycosyltransferase involved in cell wall biosynthesis